MREEERGCVVPTSRSRLPRAIRSSCFIDASPFGKGCGWSVGHTRAPREDQAPPTFVAPSTRCAAPKIVIEFDQRVD
jgi:hypothetical protein